MLGTILITIACTFVGTVVLCGLFLWVMIYAMTLRALGIW